MNENAQPVASLLSSPAPTVINLGAGGNAQNQLSGKNWFNPKMFFLLGSFLVLLVGLGVGTFLVTRPKSQNPQSKAAGTCAPIGWLENPSPTNGATNISTTPDFSWTFENGSWGQVGDWINLYLWACPEKTNSCQTAFHTKFETSGPVYSMSWSELGKATPLQCNTTYYWSAYLSDACIGPMIQEVNWHFTTGCPTQQSVTCDSLSALPLAGNLPLSVTATVSGHTTGGGSIASYKFDFGDGTSPVSQTGATVSHTFASVGSFTVKGTVVDNLGNTAGGSGNCQATVNVSATVSACNEVCNTTTQLCPSNLICVLENNIPPGSKAPIRSVCRNPSCSNETSCNCPAPTAACQMVSADKDLASVKIGDKVTFTGYGITSDNTEQIDKVNFIISTSSGTLSDTTVAATRDTTKDTSFGGKAWKGVQTFTVPGPGNYSVKIRVHWVSKDQWME